MKRKVALLLAFIMMISLLPVSAFAQDADSKLVVLNEKILVGGDHTDGVVCVQAVQLPDLVASDIQVSCSRDVLEFGIPNGSKSGAGNCWEIPFFVKSGIEPGEVTVTVKAGENSDTCTIFVDALNVEGCTRSWLWHVGS